MSSMAPCLLLPLQSVYLPSQFGHLDASHHESTIFGALKASPPQPEDTDTVVDAALRDLASAPIVAFGTPHQLSAYQEFVQQHIELALAAARVSPRWDAASGVAERLERALALVHANRTCQGRQVALEVLGFASLAALAKQSGNLPAAGAAGGPWGARVAKCGCPWVGGGAWGAPRDSVGSCRQVGPRPQAVAPGTCIPGP